MMQKTRHMPASWLLSALFAALASTATPALAADSFRGIDSGIILGGALGGGTGAAVGASVGGRDGAIIGGALGAAAGIALASPQPPVIIHKPHAYSHRHFDDDHGRHRGHDKHHRHDQSHSKHR